MSALRAYFFQHGAGPVEAMNRALATIYQMVQSQTAVLSYLHGFRMLGIVFAIVSPLAWIMRPAPRSGHH